MSIPVSIYCHLSNIWWYF